MRYHKIWEVRIASREDGTAIQELPVQETYLIESRHKNGVTTITKKAMALALEDGIERPVVVGMEWISRRGVYR